MTIQVKTVQKADVWPWFSISYFVGKKNLQTFCTSLTKAHLQLT